MVYRFASAPDLRRWEQSPSRAGLLAQGSELMQTVAIRQVSGLEAWFAVPGRSVPAPPRWKMFLVSGAVIYVLQLLEYGTLGGLVGAVAAADAALLLSFPVTAMMTWLVMPRLSALLAPWLFRPQRQRR